MYKHSKYCTVNDVLLYSGLGMLCRGDAASSVRFTSMHCHWQSLDSVPWYQGAQLDIKRGSHASWQLLPGP
jgi:hypothetical protein